MASDGMMNKVIGIALALFLTAILVPIALNTLANANYTGVDDTVQTVITLLLPVLAVIGIALFFLRK